MGFNRWDFRSIMAGQGQTLYDKVMNEIPKSARASSNVALRFLRQQPLARWSRPKASALGDHLYVIRFKDDSSKQRRFFDFAEPANHCFVICLYRFEKDGKYQPADYLVRVRETQRDLGANIVNRTKSILL